MAQKSDKKGPARGGGRVARGGTEEDEEDYGDYVTRCICGYTHDDGFMVQCDGCSVWQHVDCITVDANNLPDKYLCELCLPRTVDKKRARQLQQRKREDISDLEESRRSPSGDSRTDHHKPHPHPSLTKRRRKQSKDSNTKPSSDTKKPKKEKGEVRRGYRKGSGGKGMSGGGGKIGNIQSLLNAATLLEGEKGGAKVGPVTVWRDLWSADSSPWWDKYDTAEHNRYSDTVRQSMASRYNQLKSEAVVFSQQEYSSMESHTHPQCCVSEVQRRRMGVVAQVEIPEDELAVEYKGKVDVMSAVFADFPPGTKSLWKQKPCPFVYIYDKISDFDICIDARYYGNLARFIRRSCTPNAELRHFFVNSDLHFGVYATHTVSVQEEITLPFDFPLERCDYQLECGCGVKNCWVVRAAKGRGRGRSENGERGGGEELDKTQLMKGSSKPHFPPVLPMDEDSNSSWTSSSGRKKQRGHAHQGSPAGNLIGRSGSTGGGREGGSSHMSCEVSSDSEEESGERKKKVKSREERKTEAVMKMFQRMEASSQRRRRHLTSDGSVDSDSLSPSTLHPLPPSLSPSTLHPLPPSQRVLAQRERHGSTSTRRPSALPQTKTRLSSVSSNEGMSAADLPDAFSPPITPRLATLSSPHPLSSPAPPSPVPPQSPTYTHSPTVRFTPDLHPKYLLAQFPMPLKKALLRQWESDKHGFPDNCGKPRPLWPQDHMTLITGYVSWPSPAASRPRQRGCLKHRWLKQYSEDKTLDGKENRSTNPKTAVPLKQRMLRRWQEREQSHTPKNVGPSISKTTSVHTEPSEGLSAGLGGPSETTDEARGSQETCQSPLFEEFSDNEFEVKDFRTESERGEEKVADGRDVSLSDWTQVGRVGDGDGDKTTAEEGVETTNILEPQGADQANISDLSDSVGGLPTHVSPPPPPLPPDTRGDTLAKNDDVTSDYSGVKLAEKVREMKERFASELVSEKSEVVRKTKSLEELMSEDMEVVGGARGDGEEEGSVGRREGRGGGKSLEELMVEDMAISGAGEQGMEESLARRGGEGDMTSLMAPDPREMLPGKTPAKRKINLSEYRSRVRKPVEQRRESLSDHTSPQLTMSPSSTPSFLPPSFTHSSFLSSAATPTRTLLGGGVASSDVPPPPPPQFEPVSPDDSEPAAGYIASEGPAHPQQHGLGTVGSMPGHIPLGVLPGVTDHTLPHQTTSTFISPGSHTTATYGIETMWNNPQLEPSQDPRRHIMGGASHVGLLPHPQPHMQTRPGTPSHVMMSQPCPAPSGELMTRPLEYSAHQPRPPHGFAPTRHPPMFHPRQPGGGSGGFY